MRKVLYYIFILYVLYTYFVYEINGSTNGNCYLKGVQDFHWLTEYVNDPVDDFEEREFKRFEVNNVTDVEVRGYDYGKYFDVKLVNNNLIISPTLFYKFFEINEKNVLDPKMNIRLNFQCETGTRQLTFYQPIHDHNTYYPEFNQPLYTYILPMPLPGKFDVSVFGEVIIACDLDISNVQLDFAVNPAKDFILTWYGSTSDTNKCHKAILKTNNPLRLTSETVYQINVTDKGLPSKTKTARLKIYVNESASIPPSPQFLSPYYTANYSFENGTYNIAMDNPIRLKNGCSNIQLHLLEYQDNFRIYCISDEIIVELLSSPVDGHWEDMVVVLVAIVATLEHAERTGKTVLVVRLPTPYCQESKSWVSATECPVCSTEEASYYSCPTCNTRLPIMPIECPKCSNKSEQKSAEFIKFNTKNYSFEIEPSYQGFLGIVTANAVPEELIKYSIKEEEALLNIEKNTGILKILTQLDVGKYNFTVYAEGLQSKIRAHTNVIITVIKNTVKLNTMNSILIEHVGENEGRLITIFPCGCDYCSYEIMKQYPETNPTLFRVSNKTHLYTVPIDREMDEIINMKLPQFTLWLTLTTNKNCAWKIFKYNSIHSDREWAFIPPKVENAPDKILASIIIDDANDNPPVFQQGVALVIGYPIKSLAALISPLYLTKVIATDMDTAENAHIRYRVDHKNFIIHPITGVVYAGNDAINDDSQNVNFNIIATDKNGSVDGLSTNLFVEVKPLKQNHMIVLTVKNIFLEELDILLEKLSNNTNTKIKYLNAAIIPITNSERFLGNYTRIIVYGLNSEDELIEAHTLENSLIEECTENITIEKLNIETLYSSGNLENNKLNKVKLITTIVILSLLLAFFVNAFTAFYYYTICLKKKHQEINNMISEDVDKRQQ